MMTATGENWSVIKIAENRPIRLLAIAVGISGICYLLWKVYSLHGEDLTFKYIWFAGSLWLDGVNPYGNEYQLIGHETFTGFNGQPFYYPPNWWPISSFYGVFDYQVAMEIWRVLNASVIIISTFLLRAGLRQLGINLSPVYLVFYTGLAALMQATAISLATGQTSIMIYFGVCLIIYACLANKNFLLAIGFCIILLKPQIGVPVLVAFLAFKKYHLGVIYACGFTFVMALPGLITIGPIETISSFLQGLSQHSQFSSNVGSNSTGLKNIITTVFNVDVSSNIATLLAIAATLATGFYFMKRDKNRSGDERAKNKAMFLMLTIAMVAFLSPLHEYDMIFMAPVIFLAAAINIRFQFLISLPFLLIIRPGNLANLFGNHTVDDARYYTAVISTIAIMAILIILSRKITRRAD